MPDSRLTPYLKSTKEWADQNLRAPKRPTPIKSELWKRVGPVVTGIAGILISTALGIVWWQDRLFDLAYAYGVFVVVVLVALAAAESAPVAFPLLGYLAWHNFAGSPSLTTDLVIGSVAVSIILWGSSTERGKHWLGNSKLSSIVLGLFSTLVVWTLLSAADSLAARGRVPLDPDAYRKARESSPWKPKSVGMALSGGGYRAALFHAGVLDALEFMGTPPTHLSAVSGGSIIGSYYSLGGRPDRFRQAVVDRRFGFKRRATTILEAAKMICPAEIPGLGAKLLPFCDYGRSDVQAGLLDSVLLDGALLADSSSSGLPSLVIGGTDLDDGGAVGLTSKGIIQIRPTPIQLKYPFANGPRAAFGSAGLSQVHSGWKETPLSQAVAASGAFPFAFDAVTLRYGNRSLHIVDGGVLDNSALTVLLGANDTLHWNLNVVLVSDGSRALERREPTQSSTLGQVSRALDILSNSGSLPPDQVKNLRGKLILLSPNPMLALSGDLKGHAKLAAEFWESAIEAASRDSRIATVLNDWEKERSLAVKAAGGDTSKVLHYDKHGVGSLIRMLDTFAKAPTLQDEYGESAAFQLYQLGRFVVAINWPDIRQALDSADHP